MALNSFDSSTAVDGAIVTSSIDSSALVTAIQNDLADSYFDSTSKIGSVFVYYEHEDGRQVKKIVHEGSGLSGTTSWSSYARDGTWQKNLVIAWNHEGAWHRLERAAIGSGEDITHSDGTTYLNV